MGNEFLGQSNRRGAIGIIGGGFTGANLALQLLRTTSALVLVIERGPRRGGGLAYSTPIRKHLLNVPANQMSAYPESPGHFVRWAQLNYDSSAGPGAFLPRFVYGYYLEWLLEEAERAYPGRLQWKRDEAISLRRNENRVEVRLRSGALAGVDKLVLATGNFPPSDALLPGITAGSARYAGYAWAPNALENIEEMRSILLIGSGLTSVDTVLALRERGFRGTIYILSRHGLLPRVHSRSSEWPTYWDVGMPSTAHALLHLVRRQIDGAVARGADWRNVIDSLRPCTQRIWQSLAAEEKRRLLRHVRPYWEVHRHRLAPEVAAQIEQELQDGSLQMRTGRVLQYRESAEGAEIVYRKARTDDTETLRVDRVINCTGPETDCRKMNDPLIRDLLSQGLARPDALSLGLDVSDEGALMDSDGTSSKQLYALGPLRKGALWETTAVPEIRVQVAQLVPQLAGRFSRGEYRLEQYSAQRIAV